ncbi:MAG: AMP-binding protein, partial [Rhodobiaceae bacterium]
MTNHLYDSVFGQHAASSRIFLHTDAGAVSFADFTALTDRLAGLLVATGLAPGDRVAVQADKSVMLLALYAATVKAGGVYLPLNTGYTAAELDYFLGDAKPRIVVVGTTAADAIAPLAARGGAVLFTLDGDETGSLAEAAAQHPPHFTAVPRGPEDLAAILYTSGTTGRSKGAKLCHRNLLSNAEVLRDYWRFTADDVLLHMLPIYHTHGLFVASNLLAMVGGSMIFLPKFSVDAALKWLPTATTMMVVQTFYTR